MAKSLEKKKPGTSLHEYGDNHINFYNYSGLRPDITPPTLNQGNNSSYLTTAKDGLYKTK